MDELRSWWEVPSIAHFCSLFSAAFDLGEFDIDDFEDWLLAAGSDSGCPHLTGLLCRLLDGCYHRKDINPLNVELYLHDILKHRWEAEGGRPNPLASRAFSQLSLRLKVEVLHALCEYRLDAEDVFETLRGLDGDSLRVEPMGQDVNGATYWYFYGTRLYRQDADPQERALLDSDGEQKAVVEEEKKPEKPDKKKKKEKGKKHGRHKRGRKVAKEEEISEPENCTDTGRGRRSARRKANKSETIGQRRGRRRGRKRKFSDSEGESGDATETEWITEAQVEQSDQETEDKEEEEEADEEWTVTTKGRSTRARRTRKQGRVGKHKGKTKKQKSKTKVVEEEEEDDTVPAEEECSDATSKDATVKEEPTETSVDKDSKQGSSSGSQGDQCDGKAEACVQDIDGETGEKLVKPELEELDTKPPGECGVTDSVQKDCKTDSSESKQDLSIKSESLKPDPDSKSMTETDPDFNPDEDEDYKPKSEDKVKSGEVSSEEEVHAPTPEPEPEPLYTMPPERWRVVCLTMKDWEQLTEFFGDSNKQCERQLYRLLREEFLPDLPDIYKKKEEIRDQKLKDLEELEAQRLNRYFTRRQRAAEDQSREGSGDEEPQHRKRRRHEEEESRNRAYKMEKEDEERRKQNEKRRAREERSRRAELRERRAYLIARGEPIPPELFDARAREESEDEKEPEKETSKSQDGEKQSKKEREKEKERPKRPLTGPVLAAIIKVIEAVKAHPEVWPFITPVEETYAPAYFDYVKHPMDIETIESKLEKKKYGRTDQVIADFELIFDNCRIYNGTDSEYTEMAVKVERCLLRNLKKHMPVESSSDSEDEYRAPNLKVAKPTGAGMVRSSRQASSKAKQNMQAMIGDYVQSSTDEEDLYVKPVEPKKAKVKLQGTERWWSGNFLSCPQDEDFYESSSSCSQISEGISPGTSLDGSLSDGLSDTAYLEQAKKRGIVIEEDGSIAPGMLLQEDEKEQAEEEGPKKEDPLKNLRALQAQFMSRKGQGGSGPVPISTNIQRFNSPLGPQNVRVTQFWPGMRLRGAGDMAQGNTIVMKGALAPRIQGQIVRAQGEVGVEGGVQAPGQGPRLQRPLNPQNYIQQRPGHVRQPAQYQMLGQTAAGDPASSQPQPHTAPGPANSEASQAGTGDHGQYRPPQTYYQQRPDGSTQHMYPGSGQVRFQRAPLGRPPINRHLMQGQAQVIQGQGQVMQGQGQGIIVHGQGVSSQGQMMQGQVVQGQGQRMPGHGQMIQGHGQMMQGHGQMIQGQGQLMTGQRPMMQGQGQVIHSQGQMIQGQGQMMQNQGQGHQGLQSQGQAMQGQGQTMQGQGQVMQGQSQPMSSQVQPMLGQGQPMHVQGQPMPGQGQPMQGQGQSMQGQSQPMQVQGQPMPSQGQPMPGQGQPMLSPSGGEMPGYNNEASGGAGQAGFPQGYNPGPPPPLIPTSALQSPPPQMCSPQGMGSPTQPGLSPQAASQVSPTKPVLHSPPQQLHQGSPRQPQLRSPPLHHQVQYRPETSPIKVESSVSPTGGQAYYPDPQPQGYPRPGYPMQGRYPATMRPMQQTAYSRPPHTGSTPQAMQHAGVAMVPVSSSGMPSGQHPGQGTVRPGTHMMPQMISHQQPPGWQGGRPVPPQQQYSRPGMEGQPRAWQQGYPGNMQPARYYNPMAQRMPPRAPPGAEAGYPASSYGQPVVAHQQPQAEPWQQQQQQQQQQQHAHSDVRVSQPAHRYPPPASQDPCQPTAAQQSPQPEVQPQPLPQLSHMVPTQHTSKPLPQAPQAPPDADPPDHDVPPASTKAPSPLRDQPTPASSQDSQSSDQPPVLCRELPSEQGEHTPVDSMPQLEPEAESPPQETAPPRLEGEPQHSSQLGPVAGQGHPHLQQVKVEPASSEGRRTPQRALWRPGMEEPKPEPCASPPVHSSPSEPASVRPGEPYSSYSSVAGPPPLTTQPHTAPSHPYQPGSPAAPRDPHQPIVHEARPHGRPPDPHHYPQLAAGQALTEREFHVARVAHEAQLRQRSPRPPMEEPHVAPAEPRDTRVLSPHVRDGHPHVLPGPPQISPHSRVMPPAAADHRSTPSPQSARPMSREPAPRDHHASSLESLPPPHYYRLPPEQSPGDSQRLASPHSRPGDPPSRPGSQLAPSPAAASHTAASMSPHSSGRGSPASRDMEASSHSQPAVNGYLNGHPRHRDHSPLRHVESSRSATSTPKSADHESSRSADDRSTPKSHPDLNRPSPLSHGHSSLALDKQKHLVPLDSLARYPAHALAGYSQSQALSHPSISQAHSLSLSQSHGLSHGLHQSHPLSHPSLGSHPLVTHGLSQSRGLTGSPLAQPRSLAGYPPGLAAELPGARDSPRLPLLTSELSQSRGYSPGLSPAPPLSLAQPGVLYPASTVAAGLHPLHTTIGLERDPNALLKAAQPTASQQLQQLHQQHQQLRVGHGSPLAAQIPATHPLYAQSRTTQPSHQLAGGSLYDKQLLMSGLPPGYTSPHLANGAANPYAAGVFDQSIEARCEVENEDVVGAAPPGDAPTTSE